MTRIPREHHSHSNDTSANDNDGETMDGLTPDGLSRRRFIVTTGTASFFLATGGISALLAACTAEDQPSATTVVGTGTTAGTGTTVGQATSAIIGGAAVVLSLDPQTATEIGSIAINNYLFEGLYGLKDRDRDVIVPELAVSEPERVDDLTYRVNVRTDATFHNGDPVTVDDVVFSFERILNPDTGSLLGVFLTMLSEVSAVDDTTVEIKLVEPTGILKERLALVKIMSPSVVESTSAEELGLNPVGSGPYKLDEISADLSTIRMSRFTGYVGPREANIDQIGFDVVLEDATRLASLRGGGLLAVNDPPYQDVDRIDAEDGLSADGVPSFNQSEFIFNLSREPMSDKRVRQAVLYAIDRDRINDQVFFGQARNAVSHLPEDHPAFKRPATVYNYDPDKARSLLAETTNPTPTINLFMSNLGWLAAQAPIIQANLADVGIQSELRLQETESLFQAIVDGEHDAWLTVTDPSIFGGYDADMLLRWTYTGFIPESMAFWTTPEAQQVALLLDQALQTDDASERQRLYGEVQDIIAEEAPIFTVHHRHLTGAWSDRLVGPVLDPAVGVNLVGVGVRG